MEYRLEQLSPEDKRDYQAEVIYKGSVSLPSKFIAKDLLPIRDQGSQGSCVAQSSAAIKEIQEKKDVGFGEYMSPQFIYNLRVNQDSEGMYPRNAMEILYKIGCLPEAEYPYGKVQASGDIPKDILDKASPYAIKGYAFVNTIDTLKEAIYTNGGCIFCAPVYHHDSDMWRPKKLGDPVQGYHAMAAIGWDEDGFIIRNSWGESWGQAGCTKFPFKDWGMQSEVWTFIDAHTENENPKYSKWYNKVLRAITNVYYNMKSTFIMGSIMITIGYLISIFNRDIRVAAIATAGLGFLLWKIIKNKYYLFRK